MKAPILAAIILFVCTTSRNHAQVIVSDRTVLNALLASQKFDEDFENFGISDGGASSIGVVLSSTNSLPIISGISIYGGHDANPDDDFDQWFQWNGNNSAGTVSKTVNTSYDLHLDFWSPTLAFGLDLKDYPNFRKTYVAGVTVYGPDDSTILYSNNALNISDPANGLFFGFHNPDGGIGFVTISTIVGDTGESPLIDNLSFSTAPIPEPSTYAIALLGLSALAFRFCKR